MRRPRTAQLLDRDAYLQEIESMRTAEGLPEWTFDFIGVHCLHRKTPAFGLSSPLCLVSDQGRPDWEDEVFHTKKQAIKRAREIARRHKGVFVINCE